VEAEQLQRAEENRLLILEAERLQGAVEDAQVQMSEAFAREDQKRAGILADLEATYREKEAEASMNKEAWEEETMHWSLTGILT
jgi:hypothetical protein